MADDESNQRRKVKFLQILILMDSFEEEDVLRSHERVIWTMSWIKRREKRGAYHQLIRELTVEDAHAFARYFRMDKEKFNDLVGRISIHIQRQDTIMKAFSLLKWKNDDVDWSRDLFRLSRGAFWYNVALKVDGEGVTRTNYDIVRATMLQQFESTSNCCNMLPQQNVVLKIVRRAMLQDVDFNATMLR